MDNRPMAHPSEKMIKIVLLSLFSAIAIFLAAGAFFVRQQIHQLEARAFRDIPQQEPALFAKYLADLQRYSGNHVFPEAVPAAAQKADAGPYLNPRFDWEIGAHDPKADLALPPKTEDAIRRWKNDWPEHAAAIRTLKLNTSWMTKLLKYDHWDLEKNSILEERIRTTPGWEAEMAPFPFVMGDTWAKIRLARAFHEADSRPAFREVRHWAYLLASQESEIGLMESISVLRQERIAWNYLQAKGRAPSRWSVPDQAEILRMRAVWLGMSGLLYLASARTIERLMSASSGTIPLCAGLREGGWQSLISRALLGKVYPDRFTPIGKALFANRNRCRLGQLLVSWQDPEYFPDLYRKNLTFALASERSNPSQPDAGLRKWHQLGNVPWAQKLVGLILESVARPDPLRAYRALPSS